MEFIIKQEASEKLVGRGEVISLSSGGSSSSDYLYSSGSEDDLFGNHAKKQRRAESVLPVGFLEPIRPANNCLVAVKPEKIDVPNNSTVALTPTCKQFWKAGDYEGDAHAHKVYHDEEMDHLRVHPKFLHSNATSHKWALGAFAELLDNALDEHCNGATYVDVDVLENLKNKTKMVVVQDNGGGMTPDKMRQCMSLGYSAKSKIANTIGQYGNGFKTSTMRLGADVIVFSRCEGKYGGRAMQSIGLLSFTFLRSTGKEDIVVPIVDYERGGNSWTKYVKSSSDNWRRNLDTIVQWSPYETEEELLQQFNFLSEKGTRIIIYNLWEDDEGKPELDFEVDQHDIQIRGDDREVKKIKMAKEYSSTTHFLTYRHSLRSYASILYRRFPPGFRIVIRGKDVEHHDIVNDLIHAQKISYRPAANAEIKDPNMSATVILGFIKDAKHHIDIQGFNVYHKNRLIKPFWRVWNAAGSDGRGVIGVLEANFIEPAHDKQGFERTVALSRLENRLVQYQKTYWSSNCQLIGYAQRRSAKSGDKISTAMPRNGGTPWSTRDKRQSTAATSVSGAKRSHFEAEPQPTTTYHDHISASAHPQPDTAAPIIQGSHGDDSGVPSDTDMLLKLNQENEHLRNQNEELKNELEHTKKMVHTMDQEQEMFVSAFSEERGRRQADEEALRKLLKGEQADKEALRKKLKEASDTIQALLNKVKSLEAAAARNN